MRNYSTDLVKAIIKSMSSIDNTESHIDIDNSAMIESFDKIYNQPAFEKTLTEALNLRNYEVEDLKRKIKKLPKRATVTQDSQKTSSYENNNNEDYVLSDSLIRK